MLHKRTLREKIVKVEFRFFWRDWVPKAMEGVFPIVQIQVVKSLLVRGSKVFPGFQCLFVSICNYTNMQRRTSIPLLFFRLSDFAYFSLQVYDLYFYQL